METLKHHIVVVEQCDITDENGNYKGTKDLCIWESCSFTLHPAESFLAYLKQRYPLQDWGYDDGEDWNVYYNTDYCQYVVYLNEDCSHCILASYNKDKDTEE